MSCVSKLGGLCGSGGCPGFHPVPYSCIVSEGGVCLRQHLFLNLCPLVLWLQENIFQIFAVECLWLMLFCDVIIFIFGWRVLQGASFGVLS